MHRQFGINAGMFPTDSPFLKGTTFAEMAAVTLGIGYFYPDYVHSGAGATAEISNIVINLRLSRWVSEGRSFGGPGMGTDTPSREWGGRG